MTVPVVLNDDGKPLAYGSDIVSAQKPGDDSPRTAEELPEPPSNAAVWDRDNGRWEE